MFITINLFNISAVSIGESAGGNLAAAITARNYDINYISLQDRIPINGLLLIYPPLSCQFNTSSYNLYQNYNPILTKFKMTLSYKLYQYGLSMNYTLTTFNDPILNYTFQPLLTSSLILKDFPTTLFILAKYDVLHDDSILFAKRLQSVNVAIDITTYNSTTHGFFGKFSSVAITSIITASKKLLQINASS